MNQVIPKKKMLSPSLAAELYSVSPGTLSNWRSQKKGPRFFRVGAKILYLVTDLDSFFTSEPVVTCDSIRRPAL